MITIKVEGLMEFKDNFKQFHPLMKSVVKASIQGYGRQLIKDKMAQYPPETSTKNHAFSFTEPNTGKTIHAFYGAGKKHKRHHYSSRLSQYERTGKLGEGWLDAQGEVDMIHGSSSLSFHTEITNEVPYASFVQGLSNKASGEGGQAWMHKGTWSPVNLIIGNRIGNQIARNMEWEMNKVLDRAFAPNGNGGNNMEIIDTDTGNEGSSPF